RFFLDGQTAGADNALAFFSAGLVIVDSPDQCANDEEGGRRHDHQGPLSEFKGQRHAEHGAKAQNFTDEGNDQKNDGVAKTGEHSVQHRDQRRILGRVGFHPAHDDAVGNDQTDIGSQLFGNIRQESLQDDVDNDDVEGNDQNLNDHTDPLRDQIPHGGNREAGQSGGKQHTEPHNQ